MVRSKESAGILVFRFAAAGPEVLLVHPGGPFWAKKDDGAWSIPKGECEPGEDPRRCALRELAEELGTSPALAGDDGSPSALAVEDGAAPDSAGAPSEDADALGEALLELGSVRQKGGKVVHAWAAEGDFDPATLHSNTFTMEWPPRSGAEREFPEVDRAEWFAPGPAKEKLLAAQAPFVDRLLASLAARDE